MAKKRRAPIEQLRAAGQMARELLIARGIQAKDSIIDKIIQDTKSPTLPGIPAYLPHEWTIKATQQIMRDVVIMWKEECGANNTKAENITLFWLYLQNQLSLQEANFDKEYKAMSRLMKSMKETPVLRDIFSPLRKKENLYAIHRFIVDSFAVAVVVKRYDTTSDYLNWFLDWTQDLGLLWVRPDKRKKFKRV